MAFSLKRGRSGDAAERDYYKKTFSPGDPCADPCCIRWTENRRQQKRRPRRDATIVRIIDSE